MSKFQIVDSVSERVVRTVKSVQQAQSLAEAMTETESWTQSGREFTYRVAV